MDLADTIINKIKNRGLVLSVLYFFLLFSLSCKEESNPSLSVAFTEAIYSNAENKLWAHQMNSIDSALVRVGEFNGIELDVVFEKKNGKFNVRHDIDQESSSLYLEEYLDIIDQKNNQIFYWLDFKNLGPDNVDSAIKKLKQLLSKRNLIQRVIVESFMSKEIIEINSNGIYTSFWIPHLYSNATKEDSLKAISTINNLISSKQYNALSAHHMMFDFLNENFPENNFHLWTNGLETEEHKNVVEYLHSQSNIKVILVDYKNNFIQ